MKNLNGETFEDIYESQKDYDARRKSGTSPFAARGERLFHWLNDFMEFHYSRTMAGVNTTELRHVLRDVRRHLWVTDDRYFLMAVDAPAEAKKVIRLVESVEATEYQRFTERTRREFYRTLSKLLKDFEEAKERLYPLACDLNHYLNRAVFLPELSRSISSDPPPQSPLVEELVVLRDELFNEWDSTALATCLELVDGFIANPHYEMYFSESSGIAALLPSAKELEELRIKFEVDILWYLHAKPVAH